MTYEAERALMCAVGKLLYDRGYVAANDGNLSMKTAPDRLLVTPSGVSKGRLTPDMLLVTDLEGNVLEGNRHPSSETKMHLTVYRGRPDVGAVVHAHPPVSTAFAANPGMDSIPSRTATRAPFAPRVTATMEIPLSNRTAAAASGSFFPVRSSVSSSEILMMST